MSAQDDVAEVRRILAELDPAAVAAEVSLTTGARLKGWSADARVSGSSEPALLMFDKLDQRIRALHRAYRRDIERAAKSLRDALRRQEQICARLTEGGVASGPPSEEAKQLAEQELAAEAATCANCGVIVDRSVNRFISGRCEACYYWRRRHNTERPKDYWTA